MKRNGLVFKVLAKVLAVWVVSLIALLSAGCGPSPAKTYDPKQGDLVFQSLPHQPVVDMIEGATGSVYSHCGIVVVGADGKLVVLEALGTVRQTPLNQYLARGRNGYDVYRFKNPEKFDMQVFIKNARAYEGRPYDIRYRMDDEAIYCSELIYKAYLETTSTPLGKLVKVSELNWQPHEQTIRKIEQGGPVPLDREMITPRDLAAAPELELVLSVK